MLKKNEINLLSKTLPFWHNLNQDEKELLISNAIIENIDQGQLIHQGNNDCIGILVVINGCLRTYIVSDEGKEGLIMTGNDAAHHKDKEIEEGKIVQPVLEQVIQKGRIDNPLGIGPEVGTDPV